MWCPGKTPNRKKGISQEPVVKRDVGRRNEEKDEVGESSDKDEQ